MKVKKITWADSAVGWRCRKSKGEIVYGLACMNVLSRKLSFLTTTGGCDEVSGAMESYDVGG